MSFGAELMILQVVVPNTLSRTGAVSKRALSSLAPCKAEPSPVPLIPTTARCAAVLCPAMSFSFSSSHIVNIQVTHTSFLTSHLSPLTSHILHQQLMPLACMGTDAQMLWKHRWNNCQNPPMSCPGSRRSIAQCTGLLSSSQAQSPVVSRRMTPP